MQSKGILILFYKLQLNLEAIFDFLLCFVSQSNIISLCFAKINPAGALHKLVSRQMGDATQTILGKGSEPF